jgi:hypothetical protein
VRGNTVRAAFEPQRTLVPDERVVITSTTPGLRCNLGASSSMAQTIAATPLFMSLDPRP